MSDTNVIACLQKNQKEIFSIWEGRVRDKLPLARSIDSTTLTNSLPELYDGIINTLSATDSKKYLDEIAEEIGRHHGEERTRFKGYDLNYVIEEYQILRHVIIEVARKAGPMSDEAIDAILDAITIGIRNATSEFVKIRSEALTVALVRAENANSAKSAFLTNISHEIRTPLGGMLGYTELLKDASISERENYINVIARNGKALSKLIEDVLDLSKVEAGHLDVEYHSFALDELLNGVIELFQPNFRKKNVYLTLDIDPGTPLVVNSDPMRLRQILVNIVGNAVKFTHDGTIKVTVEPIVMVNGMNGLRFTVADTGIGMSAEETLKVFELFSQGDNSTTREFGGTGVGLFLSRRIARALGGDVILKSTTDKGSTFVVTVEARPALRPQARTRDSLTKLDRIKILLVEDSVDFQYLVKHTLELRGAIVDCADNGKEGVDKAGQNSYDIVLMDMQMPVLDGYSATQILRSGGFKVPIVALTAHAMIGEQRRSLKAGCTALITKPFDINLLVDTVKELTQSSGVSLLH